MHLFRLVATVAILFQRYDNSAFTIYRSQHYRDNDSGMLATGSDMASGCACAGPGFKTDIDKCTSKCCDEQYGNYANSVVSFSGLVLDLPS